MKRPPPSAPLPNDWHITTRETWLIFGRRRFRAVVEGRGAGRYEGAPSFIGKTREEALEKAKAWCDRRSQGDPTFEEHTYPGRKP